jgi:hypothetical protein
VPLQVEVLGNGAIPGKKPLGLSWRFTPLHAPLELACGLVGAFRTVIQITVLAMLYSR